MCNATFVLWSGEYNENRAMQLSDRIRAEQVIPARRLQEAPGIGFDGRVGSDHRREQGRKRNDEHDPIAERKAPSDQQNLTKETRGGDQRKLRLESLAQTRAWASTGVQPRLKSWKRRLLDV